MVTPVLGVIGGMGPWATIDFLSQLHLAQRVSVEQAFMPVIVSCDPTVPDRTEALRTGNDDAVVNALRGRASNLLAAGATLLAMPCNTAHAFKDLVLKNIPLPMVDMLDAVAEHTRRQWPLASSALVLATEGTRWSGVYDRALQKVGLAAEYPSPGHRNQISEAIAGLKIDGTSTHAVSMTVGVIEEILGERDVPGVPVILGCTELPLVRDWIPADVEFVDSTRCLAEAVIAATAGLLVKAT